VPGELCAPDCLSKRRSLRKRRSEVCEPSEAQSGDDIDSSIVAIC
jgi:hypothetical protein